MFLFLGLKIIFCYSAEHAAWIEDFRNNFKYLSGHPLSLDTFELKLKIKKTFFYENVTEHSCKYVQTRVHKLHRLQPYILQDNINDGFFLSIANLY